MHLKSSLSKKSEKFSIPIQKYTLKSEYFDSTAESQKCAKKCCKLLKIQLTANFYGTPYQNRTDN